MCPVTLSILSQFFGLSKKQSTFRHLCSSLPKPHRVIICTLHLTSYSLDHLHLPTFIFSNPMTCFVIIQGPNSPFTWNSKSYMPDFFSYWFRCKLLLFISVGDSTKNQGSKNNEVTKFEVSIKCSKGGFFEGTKINGTNFQTWKKVMPIYIHRMHKMEHVTCTIKDSNEMMWRSMLSGKMMMDL